METRQKTKKQTRVELLSRHCPLVFIPGTDQLSVSSLLCTAINTGSIANHTEVSDVALVHIHTCMCTDFMWLLMNKLMSSKGCVSPGSTRRRRRRRSWDKHRVLWEWYGWAFCFPLINAHANTYWTNTTRANLTKTRQTGRWALLQLVPAGPRGAESIRTFQGKMMRKRTLKGRRMRQRCGKHEDQ